MNHVGNTIKSKERDLQDGESRGVLAAHFLHTEVYYDFK